MFSFKMKWFWDFNFCSRRIPFAMVSNFIAFSFNMTSHISIIYSVEIYSCWRLVNPSQFFIKLDILNLNFSYLTFNETVSFSSFNFLLIDELYWDFYTWFWVILLWRLSNLYLSSLFYCLSSQISWFFSYAS